MKVEIIAVNGSVGVISSGTTTFPANVSKLRGPLDTVDLNELPDSRERTRAPVLRFSCEGQLDVWEMFPDNSYLNVGQERQELLVAAPTDFKTKKAESFSPQLLKGFFLAAKSRKQREGLWQQYHCAWP